MSTDDKASPVQGVVSLPYMVHTSRGYEVTGPDKDGDIEIEIPEEWGRYVFLSESDLLMMLARIRQANSVLDRNDSV